MTARDAGTRSCSDFRHPEAPGLPPALRDPQANAIVADPNKGGLWYLCDRPAEIASKRPHPEKRLTDALDYRIETTILKEGDISGTLLEIGGVADHVHLLARFKADRSVAQMVRLIKANSSKWIHQEHRDLVPGPFAWQLGYSAFSVSESQVPGVRRYLRRQPEHHGTASFQEELLELLVKNRVNHDPLRVFD